MRKVIIAAILFAFLGICAIVGGGHLSAGVNIIWHDILFVFGGIMFGGCAALLTLARLSEDNPAILIEIEKLDGPKHKDTKC